MMILLLSVCSVIVASAIGQAPTVTISQGTVVGSVVADGGYNAFYGIPYADSTSGINRFKVTLPHFFPFTILYYSDNILKYQYACADLIRYDFRLFSIAILYYALLIFNLSCIQE